jgi:hypothetical protein
MKERVKKMNKNNDLDVYSRDDRYSYYKKLFKSDLFNEDIKRTSDLTAMTQARACDYVAKIFCDFHELSLRDLKKLVLEKNVNIEKKLLKLCIDNNLKMRNIDNSIDVYKRISSHLKCDKLSRLEKRHII